MLFREHGDRRRATVLLLHGGGLSDWSWAAVCSGLEEEYHVVTPVIDGHGADGAEEFRSIEACAEEVLRYIKRECGGAVFAIGGLSLGAQIAAEVLAQARGVAAAAIIESALTIPIRGTAALAGPAYRLCYGLIKNRSFARLQAKSLCIPETMFETYYADSLRMSRQSLVQITLSNGTYRLKPGLSDTDARVLIAVGERERRIMKRSAAMLHERIPGSRLYTAPGLKHGELSLKYPERYLALFRALAAEQRQERAVK